MGVRWKVMKALKSGPRAMQTGRFDIAERRR